MARRQPARRDASQAEWPAVRRLVMVPFENSPAALWFVAANRNLYVRGKAIRTPFNGLATRNYRVGSFETALGASQAGDSGVSQFLRYDKKNCIRKKSSYSGRDGLRSVTGRASGARFDIFRGIISPCHPSLFLALWACGPRLLEQIDVSWNEWNFFLRCEGREPECAPGGSRVGGPSRDVHIQGYHSTHPLSHRPSLEQT